MIWSRWLRLHASVDNSFTVRFRDLLRTGCERRLVVLLTGSGKCGEQYRTLLAQLLQAVVDDLWWADWFELRPQVAQQDVVQRPLEQADPMISFDQLQESIS